MENSMFKNRTTLLSSNPTSGISNSAQHPELPQGHSCDLRLLSAPQGTEACCWASAGRQGGREPPSAQPH